MCHAKALQSNHADAFRMYQELVHNRHVALLTIEPDQVKNQLHLLQRSNGHQPNNPFPSHVPTQVIAHAGGATKLLDLLASDMTNSSSACACALRALHTLTSTHTSDPQSLERIGRRVTGPLTHLLNPMNPGLACLAADVLLLLVGVGSIRGSLVAAGGLGKLVVLLASAAEVTAAPPLTAAEAAAVTAASSGPPPPPAAAAAVPAAAVTAALGTAAAATTAVSEAPTPAAEAAAEPSTTAAAAGPSTPPRSPTAAPATPKMMVHNTQGAVAALGHGLGGLAAGEGAGAAAVGPHDQGLGVAMDLPGAGVGNALVAATERATAGGQLAAVAGEGAAAGGSSAAVAAAATALRLLGVLLRADPGLMQQLLGVGLLPGLMAVLGVVECQGGALLLLGEVAGREEGKRALAAAAGAGQLKGMAQVRKGRREGGV